MVAPGLDGQDDRPNPHFPSLPLLLNFFVDGTTAH